MVITSAKEVMFLRVFVCLCVSKITQKVMEGSFWNFESMLGMAKTTSDSILGMIRKESWILDHFDLQKWYIGTAGCFEKKCWVSDA